MSSDGTSKQSSPLPVPVTISETGKWWVRALEKHGWPAGFLILILFVLWQVMIWLKPMVEVTVKMHWDFVQKATTMLEDSQKCQAKQSENGERITEQMARQTSIMERQDARGEEVRSKVNDIHRATVK